MEDTKLYSLYKESIGCIIVQMVDQSLYIVVVCALVWWLCWWQTSDWTLLLFVQAVNKLAEVMNRKEFRQGKGGKDKASGADLKRKEKDLRRAQQELTMVMA